MKAALGSTYCGMLQGRVHSFVLSWHASAHGPGELHRICTYEMKFVGDAALVECTDYSKLSCVLESGDIQKLARLTYFEPMTKNFSRGLPKSTRYSQQQCTWTPVMRILSRAAMLP